MFRFCLHKMSKNRWLTLSLLAGYVIAVAIVSSMPVYSHAILSRMLLKDLENVQNAKEIYPGRVTAEATLRDNPDNPSAKRTVFERYDRAVRDDFMGRLGIPVQEDIRYEAVAGLRVVRKDTAIGDIRTQSKDGELGICVGLFDHIRLLEGRLPQNEPDSGGILEAVVSERAARELDCALNGVYDLYSYANSYKAADAGQPYGYLASVRIVGIYAQEDPSDLFWVMPESTFASALIMDPTLFKTLYFEGVEGEEPAFNFVRWAGAVDYTAMTPENAAAVSQHSALYEEHTEGSPKIRCAYQTVLEQYALRRQDLSMTLWIIQIPILLLLLLYIFMVSRLILEHEKNEIAVLRSRGCAKRQIVGLYSFQAALLALIALCCGPWLGLLFCRVIGASNGFMEFVNRKALQVSLTPQAWGYAAATAVLLALTMLLSVLFYGEASIVSFKRQKAGKAVRPLWQRLFLDFIALAISLYGLYTFRNRLEVMRQTAATASDIPIDFMLYVSSTLFILGGSLCFLRLFPLVIRLIYRIGRRFWGPVLYLSLLNASRFGGKNQSISLFLIFTLSMGVFNAVTVRTLNQTQEDRIRYTVGADIVLQEDWPSAMGTLNGSSDGNVLAGGYSDEAVYYTEPRFSKYEEMQTVAGAARVLKLEDVSISMQSQRGNGITLMGIVPDEFGKTCWFKNGLLPHHINAYLNLLAEEPRALLLSAKAMEAGGISPGDSVLLSVGGNQSSIQFTVYAGLDYFPSFNPVSGKNQNQMPILAVANLIYLQQETKLEPYEVWLKKAPGVTSAQLYEELAGLNCGILSLEDASAQLVAVKNDAMTQGINGYFTLSFLVTMLITFVGFFLYWILAVKSRLLQFGILRSMGLSRLSVVMVSLWEQLLSSAMAIGAGFGLGVLTALLFAPILECNVSVADQILPFTVVAFPEDFTRMTVIVTVMLLAAAFLLGRIVFRLHANEALKLGED